MGNKWRTRVGWIWDPCQKLSHQGSVLANGTQGVAQMHWRGCPDVAECGVEVMGGHNRAARKGGGLVVLKNRKPSSCGSVFVND